MSRVPPFALCLATLFAVTTGCNKNKEDNNAPQTQASVQDAHHSPRPIVALVPLIDHTVHDLPWSLSEEFTSTIHYRLLQQDKVYLSDLQKVQSATKKLNKSHHPFSDDLSWVKKMFPGNEFVVFMELTEHQEVALKQNKQAHLQNAPADLNISVRLRVIDVRGNEPSIVLQELVHDAQRIPKQFTRANFHQVPWGEGCYSISPLGMAHAKLCKELASRIEDYVLLAATIKEESNIAQGK